MPTKTPDRVKDLRERLATKTADIERISASFGDEDGKIVVSAEQAADYRKALNEAKDIKAVIDGLEFEANLRTYLDTPATVPTAGAETASARRLADGGKSLGQLWLESDSRAEQKAADWRRGGLATFERGLYSFEGKDVYTAIGGTVSINGIGQAQNLGLMARQLRPGRIRDLFPSDTTTANLLYGVRETGYVSNAAVVPERTAANGGPATGGPTDIFPRKPKSTITLTPYTIPVVTIAHVMYVHRNVLADDNRIRAILDRDMIDGVKMAEDEEILFGNGDGEHLTGIYNTPGVQQYTGVNGQKKSMQIRRAATRAILSYYQPSGIVVHPFDWEDLELEVDDNGAYTIAVSVAVGGEKRVWRMSLVDTPAMNEGEYVLGAFGQAAKFWDREIVNVQVSTENDRNFEQNIVTLRAEERGALEITRPEAMVLGTFAA